MITLRRTALLAAALTHATAFALVVSPAYAKQPAPSPLPSASILFRQMTSDETTKVSGAGLDNRPGSETVSAAADRRLTRLLREAVCTGC